MTIGEVWNTDKIVNWKLCLCFFFHHQSMKQRPHYSGLSCHFAKTYCSISLIKNTDNENFIRNPTQTPQTSSQQSAARGSLWAAVFKQSATEESLEEIYFWLYQQENQRHRLEGKTVQFHKKNIPAAVENQTWRTCAASQKLQVKKLKNISNYKTQKVLNNNLIIKALEEACIHNC